MSRVERIREIQEGYKRDLAEDPGDVATRFLLETSEQTVQELLNHGQENQHDYR